MRKLLAIVALLACSSTAYAAECGSVVGWVGVPVCQSVQTVPVPDVTATDAAGADTALEALSLDTGVTTPRCSAEAANQVVSQNPVAGTPVPLGSTVDLTLSTGSACPPDAGGLLQMNQSLRL